MSKNKVIAALLAAFTAAGTSGCVSFNDIKTTVKSNIAQTAEKIRGASATEAPDAGVSGVEAAEQSNTFSLGITEIDTWNPITTSSEMIREAMRLVYDPLFEINESMEAVPVLASGFTVSPDGKIVEVKLREGILWHDGGSFDAYDVTYTVSQIKTLGGEYAALVKDVKSCKTAGKDTVRFELERSVPDFASLLTFPIVRYQTRMNAGASKAPVGTGPFRFAGQIGTDKYRLEAYEGYHNGRALIDAVYLCKAPDIPKCYSMFEASEIDLVTSKMVDITTEMPRGNIRVYDYISNRMTYLGFNLSSDLVKGVSTRLGIEKLINKDRLVTARLYSRVTAADIPFNPSSYVYYDSEPDFRDKTEEANEYLSADGWEIKDEKYIRERNGVKEKLSLRLIVSSDSYTKTEAAKQIEEDLERRGIEVKISALSYEEYASAVESRDFDMFIGETDIGANQDLTPLIGEGNYFSYSGAEAQTVTAQIGMTSDAEQKKGLYIRLGEIIARDVPFVPMYFAKESVLSSVKIKSGISPTVSGFYRLSNIWSVK